MGAVSSENSRMDELADFIAHHIFRNVNINKCFTVMDRKGQAYEFGSNYGTSAPRLYRLAAVFFLGLCNLLHQLYVYEGALF